jgi:hypothetical protein
MIEYQIKKDQLIDSLQGSINLVNEIHVSIGELEKLQSKIVDKELKKTIDKISRDLLVASTKQMNLIKKTIDEAKQV